MRETNEQLIARKEIKAALETLLEVCQRNKAAFCGFVWAAEPPLVVRFGNDGTMGTRFTELLLRLDEIANERIEAGNMIHDPLDEGTN